MVSIYNSALIVQAVFAALVVYGVALGELSIRRSAAVVLFWLAGYAGQAYVPYGSMLFSSYVAVLDITLVFLIFKGDVRLS
jgi:hypothetical protein